MYLMKDTKLQVYETTEGFPGMFSDSIVNVCILGKAGTKKEEASGVSL